MKKLFHVLVVGGAVIGTGAACSKQKAAEGTAAPPAQATPSAAAQATPTAGSDAPGTPPAPAAQPEEEKGGGAGAW